MLQSYIAKLSRFAGLVKRALKGEEYDYTQGSIKGSIVLLAVPMILELSLESVFAVVDMFFVGKLGANAIATVGLTESAITIIYSLAIGLSTAATAVVARRVGEKDAEGAARSAVQSLIFSVHITLLLSIAGFFFASDILRWMGASEEVVKEGTIFTRIMLTGSLSIILLFLINGIFRGAGNAALAMKSLWIASLINIVLCPLLIYGYGPFPELGLKGAAIATVTGRSAGVLYQVYHLLKGNRFLKIRRRHFIWDGPLMGNIVKIAWPATLQFIIQSGSWIILAALVAYTGHTDASAGYQIAIRNIVFFILPAWGLSNAAATLVGQNLGAKQPQRASESVWLTAKYNAIFMLFVTLFFLLFAPAIIRIFTDDPEVYRYGVQALRIIGSGFVFYGIGMVMVQALNGAGDTRTPTIINLVGFWLLQVPLAWILSISLGIGPVGSFIAIPVAETLLAVAALYFFKKGKWKNVKV